MFDIGFSELLIVLVLGLVVLGPERLPTAIKTVSYWVRKARASLDEAKTHISEELHTDEITKNISNYNDHLKSVKKSITTSADIDSVNESLSKVLSSDNDVLTTVSKKGSTTAVKQKARTRTKSTATKVASTLKAGTKSTTSAVKKAPVKKPSKVGVSKSTRSTTKEKTAGSS